MRHLPGADGLYARLLMTDRRTHPDCVPRLIARAVTAALVLALVGCVDAPLDGEDTVFPTTPPDPTTSVQVPYLDVSGLEFCDVVTEVAGDIRVYVDPSSNFGAQGEVRDVYVNGVRAFDALAQVAPEVIQPDTALLRQTLLEALRAASEVEFDVTEVSAAVAKGVNPDRVAGALARVRDYASKECRTDIIEGDRPIEDVGDESTPERIRRILLELFPDLDEPKLDCVEPRLPEDFDPQSADFDPDYTLRVFADCRIDLNDPSVPTSIPPAPFRGPRPATSPTTLPPAVATTGSEVG